MGPVYLSRMISFMLLTTHVFGLVEVGYV